MHDKILSHEKLDPQKDRGIKRSFRKSDREEAEDISKSTLPQVARFNLFAIKSLLYPASRLVKFRLISQSASVAHSLEDDGKPFTSGKSNAEFNR